MFVMTGIKPTQFDEYIFPEWADIMGWMVGASTLLPFVCFIIYRLSRGEVIITCYSIDFIEIFFFFVQKQKF